MPNKNDDHLRQSDRLNPKKPVLRNLKETSSESEPEGSTDSDTDLNKTIFGLSSHGGSLQSTAMEDIQKQLDEMRLQLETTLSCAATEKEERIRLQEIIGHHQQHNAIVSIPAATTPSGTTTTAGNMCTGIGLPQSVPNPWVSISCMQSQPYGSSSYPLAYLSGTQSTPTSFSYVPTFLPPLTGLQHNQNPIVPPPAMTTPCSTEGNSSFHTCQVGTTRKLHDLPEFTGKPEDWPLFCTTFRDPSNMFNYTNVGNLLRLQKCLKGAAREVVEAMLIHPNNVHQAMAALEFCFGRPDILVRSQLLKASEITPIPEDKLATFLKASGMTLQIANPTILDELISKLPMSKKLEWIQRSMCFQPFPTIRHFEQWLTGAARLICLVTPISSQPLPKVGSKSNSRNVLHAAEQRVSSANSSQNCRLCKKKQLPISECSVYNDSDISARWKTIKMQRLCFCCLKYGHAVRSCRMRKSCGINNCEKKHHPSLHEAFRPTTKVTAIEKNDLSCNKGKNTKILFRVLPVRFYGEGVVVRTHALLDEGSSVTIMSIELAKSLRLKGRKTELKLQWFGQESFTTESFIVGLDISADLEGAERYKMEEAQTVNELSLPTQTLNAADLNPPDILSSLQVAGFNDACPQILIGLDNCHLGVSIRTIGSNESGPNIAETKLGYVVYGRTTKAGDYATRVLVLHSDDEIQDEEAKLTRMVDEYFSIENFGVKKPKEMPTSGNTKRALEILVGTTKKINNRYQTGLLWKRDAMELPDSYDMARRRLCSLENKFRRELEFGNTYKSIISSYVEKGYAKRLDYNEAKVSTTRTWYLPHFGVKNPNKPGKVRLVFDAVAKVKGLSLNSSLLKGPDDLKPLMTILYNFRMRPVAVTGDIKEMFHQVMIRPEDQNSQRFLWRKDEDQPVDVYVMQSMTFGATCSPCSANYVKNLNAEGFVNKYPRAVKAIIDHHYVDDYVDSFDSIAEAIDVTNAVVSIHRSGGFELRNFTSNSSEVLNGIHYQGNIEGKVR